jgi:hypothetical protein
LRLLSGLSGGPAAGRGRLDFAGFMGYIKRQMAVCYNNMNKCPLCGEFFEKTLLNGANLPGGALFGINPLSLIILISADFLLFFLNNSPGPETDA